MRSKKVRAAMIAAAACLSFTSVVAPSATALAAGYTGLAQEANGSSMAMSRSAMMVFFIIIVSLS